MGRVQDLLDKKKKNDGTAAGGSSGSTGTGRVNEMFKKKGYEVITGSDQAANAASKYAQHELKMTGKTTYAGKTYTAPVDKEYKAAVDEYNRLSNYDVAGGKNRLGRLQEEYDRLTRDGRRSMILAGDPLSGMSSDDASRYMDARKQRHEVGAQISALSKDVTAADRLQTSERYRALADEEGFSSYSGVPSEALDALDEKYAKVGGRLADTSNVMTDDERTTYNYLLANRGEEAAQEYLNFLEDELNYRAGTKWAEGIQNLGALGEFVHTAGVSVGSALDQFKTGAEAQITGKVETPSAWQYAGGALREDLDGIAGTAYDLANVAAYMAPSILVGTLLQAVGLPGAALIGSATLGLSAAGNAYTQKVQEGYTKEQAQTYAAMIGASEGALSYFMGGISALGGKVLSGPVVGKVGPKLAMKVAGVDNAFARVSLQFGGKLATRMHAEGSEEALQSVLEPLFAAMAFDETYEPAAWEDISYSYLLGALSAGLFEGATISSEFTGYRATGKEYIQLGDEVVNSIIETGLESEADTVSHVVAQRLLEKQQAGQGVTAFELGQLYAENVKQVASEYAAGRFNDESVDSAAQEAPRAREQTFESKDTTRTENAAEGLKMRNAEARATQAAYEAGKANLPRQMANISSEAQEEAYMAGQRDRIANTSDAKLAAENQKVSAYTGINETEVMNNGAEEVHLRDGSKWTGGANPGGAVSAVEGGTGRAPSWKAQGRSADRETARLTYGEAVSTSSLGIAGGSDKANIRIVTGGDTVATKLAKAAAKKRGLRVVFFTGDNLEITQPDGTVASVRGYISGDRVFIRVDHPLYTADQIMRHEAGHDMIDRGEIDPEEVRGRLASVYGAEKVERLAQMYVEAYAGSNMTPDEIWVEVICDSLGDMNIFAGTASEQAAHELLTETKKTAVETEATQTRGPPADGKASIESWPDGKKYVRADRQVIFGNDPDEWGEQVERYINKKVRGGEDVALTTDDGDVLLLTKDTEGKASFRNYVRDKNGVLRPLTDEEYLTKLTAETHIDELAKISVRSGSSRDIGAVHGELAENGWNYRTAFFQDFDGQYYKVTISIAKNNSGNVVYNVGKIEKRSLPSFSGSSANSGARTGNASREVKVSQDAKNVKGHFSQELPIETRINQAMTMAQAKDMVQRAFVLGGIKEWFEGEYRNGDEWLRGEGADAVALVIDNEWALQEKYLNKIQGLMDDEFTTEDILEAYAAGTLTGKPVQDTKPKRLDVSGDVAVLDDRFYAPHQIEDAKAAYELASQKVTNKNRDAVYKARADVIMFAHTRGAAEALGLTQSELNKKLSTWARYTARARETSQRFNAGVADWNKWTGIENSNILTRATVSNEDLDRLVGEITGDNDGFQRKYIMRTMLALDTHIDYTGLKFEFVGRPSSTSSSVNGLYSNSERKIRVKYNAPFTVAHEMGHYLDYQWARDIGVGGALTDGFGRSTLEDPDVKQWVSNFDKFKDSLTDAADLHSSYTMDAKEVFARFVDKFVRWVNFTANGEQDRYTIDRNDKFTAQHYIEFVRLLQEKSALDANRQVQSQGHESAHFSRELDSVNILREQNEALQEKVEYWKSQTKRTTQPTLRTSDVEKLAKKVIKNYDSELDAADIVEDLKSLGEFMLRGGDPDTDLWAEIKDRSMSIAHKVVNSAQVLTNGEVIQDNKDIRAYLRKYPLAFEDKGDIADYNEFRKRNFGRFTISKDGTPVDVAWNELQETFGESYFPANITHPADQIMHIADLLDNVEAIFENPFSYHMAEATEYVANDIVDSLFSDDLRLTPSTFADRQAAKLDQARRDGKQAAADARLAGQMAQGRKMASQMRRAEEKSEAKIGALEEKLAKQKERDRERIENLRQQKNERIAEVRKYGQERTKAALKAVRADRDAKIADLKENYKQKSKKASESRKASELRGKIRRHAKDLSAKLLRPSDKRHIPEALRGAVVHLLDAINLEDNYELEFGADAMYHRVKPGESRYSEPTKRTKAFAALKEQYVKLADELTVDPDLLGDDGLLSDVIAMADKRMVDMTAAELEVVWQTMRAIEASVSSANKAFAKARWETISEAAEGLRADNAGKSVKAEYNGPLGTMQKLTGLSMMTPEAYLHRLGKVGDAMFRMMRDAQDAHIRMMKDVADFTHDKLGKVKVNKLEKTMHTVTLGGEKVKLSTAQLMELYVLMRRQQAREHIVLGGILPDVVSNKGIKKITRAEPMRGITLEEIGNALSLLSAEEVRIAETLQEFASTKLSDWGNEASMKVYNYKKFNEKNYWPIRTNKQETQSNVQKDTAVTSVANRGFTKATKPHANTSVRLGSIFDTFSTHSSEMATYAAWLAASEDINRIRNYTFRNDKNERTGTVKGIIERVHGTQGTQYLQKLLADIANGVKGTHGETQFMSSLVGNYKAASVGANLRVIIQQPTSILRAMDMLGPQYLVAGAKPAGGWKKALKYAPIAQWKDWGYFDINTGRQMKDVLFDSADFLGKVRNFSMAGAGKMDSMAWGVLWNAVESETKAKHKDLKPGTEEFYKTVATRFTEIVDHTQVVDGILQRSDIMRSADGLTKMATSFMAEPTKQYNMMMSAAYDAKHIKGEGKKAAKQRLARASVTLLISGVVNAAAQTVMDAIRDDDKEKDYWEKWLNHFFGFTGEEEGVKEHWDAFWAGNLGNTVNPAAYIPYVKDILSITQGYDVSRMDMESIEKTITAAQNMMKALNGDGKYTTAGAAINLLAEVARLVGVPVANLKREVLSFATLAAIETDNYLLQYRLEKWCTSMNYSGNKKKYTDILYNAYQNDKEAFALIYADLLKEDELKTVDQTTAEYIAGALKPKLMDQLYDLYVSNQAAYEALYNDLVKRDFLKSGNKTTSEVIATAMETRMKEAQGVKKVEDLDHRYLPPTLQTRYDKTLREAKGNDVWSKATPKQKDKLEDNLYTLLSDTDDGEKMREKVEGGAPYGISEADYLLYKMALEMADEPNKNGKLGTYTNAEVEAAIEMLKLSDEESSYLWLAQGQHEKSNPWK